MWTSAAAPRTRRASMGEVFGETPIKPASAPQEEQQPVLVEEEYEEVEEEEAGGSEFEVDLDDGIQFSSTAPTQFNNNTPDAPTTSITPLISSFISRARRATSTNLESSPSLTRAASASATDLDKMFALTTTGTTRFQSAQFLTKKRTIGGDSALIGRERSSTANSIVTRQTTTSSSYHNFALEDSDDGEEEDDDEARDDASSSSAFYLHVRHVTPALNNVKLSLKAVLFSPEGEKLAKCELSTCQDANCRTTDDDGVGGGGGASPCMFHFVGGPIHLPSSFVVGYVQLKKRVVMLKRLIKLRQAADVFIQDVILRRDPKLVADTDVVAYFRFCGFVFDGAHVVVRNLLLPPALSRQQHERALEAIAKTKKSKAKFIQDRLLPSLEWADSSPVKKKTPSMRTRASLMYKGIGVKLEMDYMSTEETMPFLANTALALGFAPHFFDGAPGFAAFPTRDVTFSAIKFEEFYRANTAWDTAAYARSSVPQEKNNAQQQHALSYVDFSPFMLANLRFQQNQREVRETKHIVLHYDEDRELARQYLEGLFCTHLHRLRRVEDGEDAYGKYTARQRNQTAWVLPLASTVPGIDLVNKPIFFADYSKLVGIPRNEKEKGYFAPARCLFQVVEDVLMPLAISLYYEKDEAWHTHLPSQHSTWRIAKLFLKCAAGQEHQLVSHALQTHLCVEPFAIALERKVPLHHMLYRVLKPHFRYTLDLNFKSKTLLLNENGRWDYIGATGGVDAGHVQFIVRHFREWSFDQMCLPSDLERRGFDGDPNNDEDFPLPGYMYAQDGMRVWEFVYDWVDELVALTYETEDDFSLDDVSREYFREVEREGFAGSPTFHPTSREELVRVLTGVIYTSTVTHAAVNYPQFAHYGFVANSPLILAKPAPKPVRDGVWLVNAYLPSEAQCIMTMRAVWGLSRFTLDDERFLLATEVQRFFNLSLWNDPRYRDCCQRLSDRLQAFEQFVLARPATAFGTHYQWLLPSTIPTSITT